MMRTLLKSALTATLAVFATAAHAEEGHLFIVYNYESGDLLVRGNLPDAEVATILPETQSIRATGWDSADVDPTPGYGSIACVVGSNVPVWFTWSTGHPDEATAIDLAKRGAEKHAAKAGGTVVPRCGPTWNNQGQRIWENSKAPQ